MSITAGHSVDVALIYGVECEIWALIWFNHIRLMCYKCRIAEFHFPTAESLDYFPIANFRSFGSSFSCNFIHFNCFEFIFDLFFFFSLRLAHTHSTKVVAENQPKIIKEECCHELFVVWESFWAQTNLKGNKCRERKEAKPTSTGDDRMVLNFHQIEASFDSREYILCVSVVLSYLVFSLPLAENPLRMHCHNVVFRLVWSVR